MEQEVLDWLLGNDPVVKFLTKRDLLDLPEGEWKEDRDAVFEDGWVKRLLDHQDPDGKWGGGLYTPKFISTHYTLQLLRRFEVAPHPQILKGCDRLIEIKSIGNLSEEDPKRVATCITGMGLAILVHFQCHEEVFEEILNYLESAKIKDGGWNCRYNREKVSHSSVHTTISVLEGLANLESNYPSYHDQVQELRASAHEFLLIHELYKSHTTGEIIHPNLINISFPPRWKYNILSALDYFRAIEYPFDDRMAGAIQLVQDKSRNGYFTRDLQMSGKTFFALNQPRKPDPFNTIRAHRVLKTYSDF